VIGALILRDVRRGFTGGAWLPIAFFLLVATLVPFAIYCLVAGAACTVYFVT